MTALKNAAHLVVIALWIVLGVLFSLKTVFAGSLLPVVYFWAWFAGYAAFTTWVTSQFKSALGTLATHGATILLLQLVPKVAPFIALRLGFDLLF